MKTSLHWLSDFLPGPLDANVAAEALTHGGLPVEVIETHGDDTVIDVEVTSNRRDCLSHIGVARELSALLNREFIEPKYAATESKISAASQASVVIEAASLCPHYTARIIRGVKIGPSPAWMQKRLLAIGVRPINNVVDITNYVLFELGQPLHAFDFDKLAGGKIIVRNARANESIKSIDGHERKLSPDMLVIADENKPVAIAGVMGGVESEVSGTTVNVLLESARFDPLSIRTTARKLAMKSDSSYRFERSIDPTLPRRASLRAAQLILEIAGGELLGGVLEAGEEKLETKNVTLRIPRIKQLLGMEISSTDAMAALNRLKLQPKLSGEEIIVPTPAWRSDINIEVDLIEEVARIVGYEKIPVRDEISIRLAPPQPQMKAMQTIRQSLVASGYFEAVTVSFVSDLLADDFTPLGATLPRADAAVRKADARLRPSLLPGLLEAIRRNEAAGVSGAKLFEAGSAFAIHKKPDINETRKLAIAGDFDLRTTRGAIESLLQKLDASRELRVIPAKQPGFAPDVCGELRWGDISIGHIGQVDSRVIQKLDLRSKPIGAELDLSPLIDSARLVPHLKAVPRFPSVRRDLSLIVAEKIRFDDLQQLVDKTRAADLEHVEFVGTYRGKPLEKGQKSVTLAFVFRSDSGTLTSDAVDVAMQRITAAAVEIGATLRV